jgi:hypothetical protein
MSCTIVSAYYKIDSKYAAAKYKVWIANFMTKLPSMQCIIYTNRETYENTFAGKYPETDKRKYRFVEMEDFVVSKYDWNQDYVMDIYKSVGHTPKLYQVWAEKTYFLQRAMQENPYSTDYFFWNDIGLFRTTETFANYPNISNVNDSKVYFVQVYPFSADVLNANPTEVDGRFYGKAFIAGGSFGGHRSMCERWIGLFTEMLEIFDTKKIFKGQDQMLYLWIMIQNPSLFSFVRTPCYDSWFAMNYFLNE